MKKSEATRDFPDSMVAGLLAAEVSATIGITGIVVNGLAAWDGDGLIWLQRSSGDAAALSSRGACDCFPG